MNSIHSNLMMITLIAGIAVLTSCEQQYGITSVDQPPQSALVPSDSTGNTSNTTTTNPPTTPDSGTVGGGNTGGGSGSDGGTGTVGGGTSTDQACGTATVPVQFIKTVSSTVSQTANHNLQLPKCAVYDYIFCEKSQDGTIRSNLQLPIEAKFFAPGVSLPARTFNWPANFPTPFIIYGLVRYEKNPSGTPTVTFNQSANPVPLSTITDPNIRATITTFCTSVTPVGYN